MGIGPIFPLISVCDRLKRAYEIERDVSPLVREERDALVDRQRGERDDEERDLAEADQEAVRRPKPSAGTECRPGQPAASPPCSIRSREHRRPPRPRTDRKVDPAREDDERHPDRE